MSELTASYEGGLYTTHGLTHLPAESQLNRENLYCMRSPRGNPQLNSLNALLHSMGLRLAVEVDSG